MVILALAMVGHLPTQWPGLVMCRQGISLYKNHQHRKIMLLDVLEISFPAPEGYIEGSNNPDLRPKSLYWAQLEDRIGPVSSVADTDQEPGRPNSFTLYQNYPNPFNPVTIINYQLSMTNDVKLTIYNLLGQKVATLVSEKQKAGHHHVEWDASGFASGVYYYRLSTDAGFVQAKKLVLLK